LVLAPSPAAAGEYRVRATLEPERIGIDETATFSIEVQGDPFGRLGFRPFFALENFEVVGGPSEFDNIQLGTGRMTRSVRYTWRLRAISTGRARVHSLRIRMGGKVFHLGDREVQVQEEPTGLGSPAWTGDQDEATALDRILNRWERAGVRGGPTSSCAPRSVP
jgi:hypothetical protein